jgi:hypothetical protein
MSIFCYLERKGQKIVRIMNSDHSTPKGDLNQKIRLTQVPGYTRGGIMFLGGVSTPCQSATPYERHVAVR